MMAKKPKRAISEYQKVAPMPRQHIKRRRTTAHLTDRKETQSLKNLPIIKAFPPEQTDKALLAQENEIMAEIGRIISSTLNIEEVYERFAEEARKLIPLDRIALTTFTPDHRFGTIAYVIG